jgi:hypothetical protein
MLDSYKRRSGFSAATGDGGDGVPSPWLPASASELISLLDVFRISCATDERDHVYALLALSKEAKDPALVADYREKVEDTYRRYAKYSIGQGKGIDLLYCVTGDHSEMQLPSWVPDWSYSGMPHFRFRTAHGGEKKDVTHFRAGGAAESNSIRLGRRESEIIASAIIIDKIEQRTPIRDVPPPNLSLSSDWDADLFKSKQDVLAKIILEMEFLLRNCDVYWTGEAKEDVIWKTALGNCMIGNQSHAAPASHRELFVAFKFTTQGTLEQRMEMLTRLDDNLKMLSPELQKYSL